MNKEKERKNIINFLQWNDQNGCYTDENCDLEEVTRMTYEESVKYFFCVVNTDAYYELSDTMADLEYGEVIQYAKDNNFYNKTMEKLSKLINVDNPTIELYNSLV